MNFIHHYSQLKICWHILHMHTYFYCMLVGGGQGWEHFRTQSSQVRTKARTNPVSISSSALCCLFP